MSVLLPRWESGWLPITGEGGHTNLALKEERQSRVMQQNQARFGHVSLERVSSGHGLVNIHCGLCCLATGQWPDHPLTPVDVVQMALSTADPVAQLVMHLFCKWLGLAVGDLGMV